MKLWGLEVTLKDLFELVIAVFLTFSSFRNLKVSRRVEEGINKINDLQGYNKQRKVVAKILEETKQYVEDELIDITNITYFSKIQAALSRIELHSSILTSSEIKKLEDAKHIIKLDELDNKNRKLLLEHINYFIAKLLKGDVLI